VWPTYSAAWQQKVAELSDVKDELERTKRELNEKVQAVAEAEASAHKALAELKTAQLEAQRSSTALSVSAVAVRHPHQTLPKTKMSKEARKKVLKRLEDAFQAVQKQIESNLAELEATRVRRRTADAAMAAAAVPPTMR
jgi:chromosome segregation ATPase